MEVEEIRTIVISLILLDDWQYHRLYAHLEIGFVFAAVACLGSLVAETTTLIILFFQLVKVDGVHSGKAEYQLGDVVPKLGKWLCHFARW